MENVTGSADPIAVAKEFTQDLAKLIDMLYQLYPHLTNRTIKTRFTKIRKKLNPLVNPSDDDGEATDSSQTF